MQSKGNSFRHAWRLVMALIVLCVPAARADAQKLTIQGDRFAVDAVPKFLTLISYFGAMGAPNAAADLHFLHGVGFDGVRIWPKLDTGPQLMNRDGSLRPTHLLQATGGGRSSLRAVGPSAGPWETFVIERTGGGVIRHGDAVTLRVKDSSWYVSADGGGGGTVSANGVQRGAWETFTILFVTPHSSLPPGAVLPSESSATFHRTTRRTRRESPRKSLRGPRFLRFTSVLK